MWIKTINKLFSIFKFVIYKFKKKWQPKLQLVNLKIKNELIGNKAISENSRKIEILWNFLTSFTLYWSFLGVLLKTEINNSKVWSIFDRAWKNKISQWKSLRRKKK